MPLLDELSKHSLTPEQLEGAKSAFAAVLLELGLIERDDPLVRLVAETIINVASAEEPKPDIIRYQVLKQLTYFETEGAATRALLRDVIAMAGADLGNIQSYDSADRFDGAVAEATGRPSYHPAGLLKLYIYGYLNRVQSSRRLEREAGRNVEVMWLTGRLIPDHKTIADFRKDGGVAIKQVCVQFIELCRQMGLLATSRVAIDGSKFKAVNNRDKNFTRNKVERRRTQLEESVARYLAQLDTADRQEPSEELAAKAEHLKEKLVKLEGEMQRLAAMERMMLASPDRQISLTDPDSRSMATSGRGSGVVGYNVQVAVDTEHHLIITHEVTNSGSDQRPQLAQNRERLARQGNIVRSAHLHPLRRNTPGCGRPDHFVPAHMSDFAGTHHRERQELDRGFEGRPRLALVDCEHKGAKLLLIRYGWPAMGDRRCYGSAK